MLKRYATALLVLFALLDLAFTFVQNCQLPIDGDLAAIVLPSPWYQAVLHDPLGWAVLRNNAVYAAPNRFFAHAALLGYMRAVPGWLQAVASPLDSIYLASALFGTAVQAGLLALLATYVRLARPAAGARSWWLTVAILGPLFQTAGFYGQMGVVSRSLTYTFFYTFPLLLLLLWLLPFYGALCRKQPLRLPALQVLVWLGLAVVLALNGPVVPAAAVVLGAVAIGQWAWQIARRPAGSQARWARPVWWSGQAVGLGLAFAVLCAYSLFIGRNNIENGQSPPLAELYQRLPHGVVEELTSKLGLPLLTAFVLLNAQLLRRYVPTAQGDWVRRAVRWVGLFAAVYILLLPLGGYRPYRYYLLRNDSILPVLLGLLFAYGLSSLCLLRQLPARPLRWYGGGLGLLLLVFMNADRRLWLRENNSCERQALAQLAHAPEPVVRLPADCPVMSWERITDPAQSATNADLLYYWGVTPDRKRYYQ
jgi:hypothetical protein